MEYPQLKQNIIHMFLILALMLIPQSSATHAGGSTRLQDVDFSTTHYLTVPTGNDELATYVEVGNISAASSCSEQAADYIWALWYYAYGGDSSTNKLGKPCSKEYDFAAFRDSDGVTWTEVTGQLVDKFQVFEHGTIYFNSREKTSFALFNDLDKEYKNNGNMKSLGLPISSEIGNQQYGTCKGYFQKGYIWCDGSHSGGKPNFDPPKPYSQGSNRLFGFFDKNQLKMPFHSGQKWAFMSGPHAWSRAGLSGSYHFGIGSGLDMSLSGGDVLAMASGTVVEVETTEDCKSRDSNTLLGCWVAIRNDFSGTILIYGHIQPVADIAINGQTKRLREGEWVPQGTIIGNIGVKPGTIGHSDGPHVHVELRDGTGVHYGCRGSDKTKPEYWNLCNWGNPIDWHGVLIDGYLISGYYKDGSFTDAYNYDGLAFSGSDLNSAEIYSPNDLASEFADKNSISLVTSMKFTDTDGSDRSNVHTWMTSDAWSTCDTDENNPKWCEKIGKSYGNTVFANKGLLVSSNDSRSSDNSLSLPLLDSTNIAKRFSPRYRLPYSDSSLQPPAACDDEDALGVFLYENQNYNRDTDGDCIHLLESEPNLGNRDMDNEASSIRINGEYTVKLYKDINYGGGSPEEVNKDDPDLDKRSLGGQYSSVRIESPTHCENENLPGVYLYSEEDHDGNCAHITGDVADLDDTAVGNDGPRSLRIVGPYYVVMYKDPGFSGPSDEFGENQDDLTWRSLGDQYSSVRFYEKNKPPVLALNTANGTNITGNNQEVWSNTADWNFSGTASDSDGSVSRVEFNCDGDTCYERNRQISGTSSWSYSRTGLTGYNRIYFFAYDDDGVRSGERDRSAIHLYVDQAAPATTASLNGESNRERWPDWFTRSVQVRLDAQDGATGRARRGVAEVSYRVDSGEWQTVAGSSATFTVNSDGSHQVEFYAVDGVGNREATQSIPFHVDQTPPSPPAGVTETHNTPHNSWQRDMDTPTFTWSPSTDTVSGVWGYQFYFDTDPAGIGYQTFLAGDPLTWTPRPDGVRTATYYLRGRSRDVAGNWSNWADIFTFRYDGTPPENPDAATHAAGVANDSWQRDTALADFAWAEPHDEGSGVNGYYTYWGLDPAGVVDAFTIARSFQSNTPLCAADSACTGYLRLRSVDNVQNQAEEWSTVFALRYDNAPPTVDFTFNGGVTQTAQTQITLDIQAADLGSGVKEMRFSSDGQNWTEWEVHRSTRAWTIPGISRKDWPVYAQVRDGVGLESSVVMRRIYLDVNPQRPRSDNFRLYANYGGAGAEAHTSAPSNMRLQSTVGQATDTKPIGSANFTLLGGYQAGAGAIPLIEPGHDDFNFINGLFASGVYSDTLRSASFQMVGSLGEVGLPNNRPAVQSNNFQLRPGFLAAEPVVKPLPAATPEPGPTPEPEPTPDCAFPQVSINNGASFTNQPVVLISLCAPRAVEMKIASDSSFVASDWEAYSARKAWTLPVDGKTVAPRFVYVLFKDRDGTVHGTYMDDIIYDPNPPSGALAAGDSVPASIALRSLRTRSAKADQYSFFQVGSTIYMQQIAGRSLSQPVAVLRARSDGSVDLFVDAQDDNSGLAQMQFGVDTGALESAVWESYSALKPWTPAPEDGIQTVYARIKDDAGNVSDTSQVSFVVDTQSPVGGIAVARQVVGPDETSLTIYLGAEDNLTGVAEMRLSQSSDFADAAWVPYTTLWAWGLDAATYPTGGTLYVQYRDLAGNVSETYSDSFVVDAVAPLLYAEVGEGDSLTRQIQLHAYDELAGLGSVTVSNDPQMLTNTVTLAYTDILTWTFDESQVAWVQVEDQVGNRTLPYPAYAALPYDAQSIPVAAGWNLNSFAVQPADASAPTVLASLAGNYAWIQGDGTFYNPAWGPEHNTLDELHPETAYYIYTIAEEEVALMGMRISLTTPIALQSGWNWIGYLPDTTLPVDQALQSIAGKYQRILSITDTYESLLPDNSYLTVLEPGQGYLIYMNEPATLVYPEVGAASAVAPRQTEQMSGCDVAPTPLLTLVYGDVSINGQPAPGGARIEALNSAGVVVGCFIVQKTGQFGLMHVYGGWDPTQSDETVLREGAEILWRVNGVAAQSDVNLLWQSDLSPHRLNLEATMKPLYLPLIGSSAGLSSADLTTEDMDVYLPFTNR